jgi:hypothetical protein
MYKASRIGPITTATDYELYDTVSIRVSSGTLSFSFLFFSPSHPDLLRE